jgi:hypothetical protein
MKVNIGPYINWVGPYQLANLLQHLGVSEDRCHEIGEWLSNTWVDTVCRWIHDSRKRRMDIRIDKYDTWSMDSTLSPIILPMLRQLKEHKHGAPNVADADVPARLQSTTKAALKVKKNECDTDGNHFKRWDWVLSEMIWTFEQLQPDYDWEDQYYTGVADYNMVCCKEDADGKPLLWQMVEGPNHTQKFDKRGYLKHDARIQHGLELFGKYFRNLWD